MTIFYFEAWFGMIAAYVMLLELIAKKGREITRSPGKQ